MCFWQTSFSVVLVGAAGLTNVMYAYIVSMYAQQNQLISTFLSLYAYIYIRLLTYLCWTILCARKNLVLIFECLNFVFVYSFIHIDTYLILCSV